MSNLQQSRFSKHVTRLDARKAREEIPPLFDLAMTTKVLALMGQIGPITRKDLDALRPGINVRRAIRNLQPYIDAGIVVTFRVQALRQQPRIWR